MSVLILVFGIFLATMYSMTANVEGVGGIGNGALSYLKNNMLGNEGLGSFGGGDTDIEGDDS
jgi:hypothetical protein